MCPAVFCLIVHGAVYALSAPRGHVAHEAGAWHGGRVHKVARNSRGSRVRPSMDRPCRAVAEITLRQSKTLPQLFTNYCQTQRNNASPNLTFVLCLLQSDHLLVHSKVRWTNFYVNAAVTAQRLCLQSAAAVGRFVSASYYQQIVSDSEDSEE